MIFSVFAVSGVAAGALGIGAWGVRFARTTSDLLVASRAISPWWNAAAVSGEYISASSFLGIAGLTVKLGTSALWQPVAFGAGYLALLLFVAAPLRRFGTYTIPDFAEARLQSVRLRLLAAGIVLLIAGVYLVPQLKAAGLTIHEVTGAGYAVGVGGMRGITYVQAFQYWVKIFAISLPAILLVIHLGGLPARAALFGRELPRAPAAGLVVHVPQRQEVTFPQAVGYRIDGRARHAARGEKRVLPRGELYIPPGAAVPVAKGIRIQRGNQWSRPVASTGPGQPLLVYSLLLALSLGTMGLPHILVRFYTNPDGAAARRTTIRVIGLLGFFYAFPGIYGLLGRALLPGLYVTGETDSVVLRLPHVAWPGLGGDVLAAVVSAGAFAAFTATASGLLVAIAGAVSYDMWGRVRRPASRAPADRRRAFRIAAPTAMVLPAVIALFTRQVDISLAVGWALGIAASTFCPLLLLGIWWTRLTARAAAAGLVVGAATSTTALLIAVITQPATDTVTGALLTEPAVITVPIAFATMIGLSLLERAAPAAQSAMLALHAAEGLGVEPVRSHA